MPTTTRHKLELPRLLSSRSPSFPTEPDLWRAGRANKELKLTKPDGPTVPRMEAMATLAPGCSSHGGGVSAPQVPASFVAEVQDAEWSAALDAKESLEAEPRLVSGE